MVVGLTWLLAVPTVLPAAYHGHVHTGHEHAQFDATPFDPGGQSTAAITAASENTADATPTRSWTAVRNESLPAEFQAAFHAARRNDANSSSADRRDRYRRLASEHRFVADGDRWYELDVDDAENYTVLHTTAVDPGS